MKFNNLGLKPKIMSGSFLPMIICLFLGVTGVWTLRMLADSLKSTDRIGQLIRYTLEIEKNAAKMETALHEYLLTGEDSAMERHKTAWTALSNDLAAMKKTVGEDKDAIKALDDAARSVDRLQAGVVQPLFERRKGIADSQAIREVNELASRHRSEKSLDDIRNIMTTLRGKLDSLNAEQLQYGVRGAKIMENVVIYGLSISTVLTLAISYFLASGITRHLMAAVTFSESVSSGDLSGKLYAVGADEVGRLGESLNTMVVKLREQISRILGGVNVLTSASAEVAATVGQVAVSTAQTSSALTEVTTTVEEVKQSSRVASAKAKDVAHSSQQSVQVAEAGQKFTENTIEKMGLIRDQMETIGETVVRLSEHSRQIGAIMATVQDIADQSNLLAVNASIEAARAGDQGKGFAVVAQEIKNLADQSKQATEQVRSILEDTGKWVSAVVMATEQGAKAVQSGVEQSIQSGEAIGRLSGTVASSSQSASVIQAAIEQQSIGVDQVFSAMVSIEQALRQISNSTNQLEPAAQRLNDLGVELKDSVQHYKM